MRVKFGQLAFGVLGVVRDLRFMGAAHGRAAAFDSTKNAFLLLQRCAVPALDKIADDPNRLIAAVRGPGRFVAAGLDPDDVVHGLGIVGIGVGGTVAKTEEVACALRRHARFLRRLGRHAAFLFPAHQQQVRQVFHDVAQGVNIGVGGVGAKLQAQVAVAAVRVERIVGKTDHADQALGLGVGQAKSFVEQRLANRDGDGQVIRRHDRAENPRIHRWQFRVDLSHRTSLHQERDALVEGAEQAFQVFAISGEYIKRHQHAGCRTWGDDAALMFAVEVVTVFGCIAARGFSDLRGAGGHGGAAQCCTGQGDTGGAHAHQYPATLKVEWL
ncbi:hypothetical protein D3C87_1185600 [compost metagenome]